MTRAAHKMPLPSPGKPLPMTRQMVELEQQLHVRRRSLLEELGQLEAESQSLGEPNLGQGAAIFLGGLLAIGVAVTLLPIVFGLAS